MQRASRRRPAGFTLVEMMTVVLIVAIVMTLLLFGIQAVQRSAARVACVSNIRQLGLATKLYDAQYQVMPSVHTNLWALAGDQHQYPGMRVEDDAAFASNDNDKIPDLYRCRTDGFRVSGVRGCSYAPNYQDAPHTRRTGLGGPDEGNELYSPWSNFKLDGSQDPVPTPDRLLRARSLTQAHADTILLIECWNRSNVVDVTDYQNAPLAPITGYDGAAADPTLDNPGDAGVYRLLADFGEQAAARGRTVHIKHAAYHRGKISVFFADQHAESRDVADLTHRAPNDIPAWTRGED